MLGIVFSTVVFMTFASEALLNQAADYVRSLLPKDFVPEVGIVCGSGLGGLAAELQLACEIKYENIPGFVSSTGTLL